MTKWEYWVHHFSLSSQWGPERYREAVGAVNAKLNEAGESGWELIEYRPVPVAQDWTDQVDSYGYLLIFKRPKPQ